MRKNGLTAVILLVTLLVTLGLTISVKIVFATGVTIQDLGTLGGTSSFSSAVNNGGQVVGFTYLPDDTKVHAFSWTPAGGMTDLGTLGGTYSGANAVNASGQIVGGSSAADGTSHAVLWQAPQSTN